MKSKTGNQSKSSFRANQKVADDYEPCGTCGFDHEYDVPLMHPAQREEVKRLHIEASEVG